MKISKGVASLKLPRPLYTQEAIEAAARALIGGIEVNLGVSRGFFEIQITADDPKGAAGIFLNEALSHVYRQRVIRFSSPLTGPVLSRALDRCFPPPGEDPLEMLEPTVREDRTKDAAALLDAAKRMKP